MSTSNSLDDLDFTAAPGGPDPAPAPTASDKDQALIGSQDLKQQGYHVVLARPREAKGEGKCRVLVVEDDEDTSALSKRALTNGGYVVTTAASAKETAHLLKTLGLPDLLLLDVDLPGQNGFDMLRHIRAHPKLSHLPVVMFTARGTAEDIIRGLTLGADGYVVKPIAPRALLEVVGRVLGR